MSWSGARPRRALGRGVNRSRLLQATATAMALVAGMVAVPLLFLAHRPFGDWVFYASAGRQLLTSHRAHIFRLELVQMGPPPLLLIGITDKVFGSSGHVAIGIAAASLAAWATWRVLAVRIGYWPTALLGAVAVAVAWVDATIRFGHPEDVLALTCIVTALTLVQKAKPSATAAAVLVGIAAACKPWSLIASPLLLGLPREKWLRALTTALEAAVVWWIPFVVEDPISVRQTLTAKFAVQTHSPLHLIGIASGLTPHWVRPTQLLLATAACGFLVMRGRMVEGLVAAFAIRVLIEGGDYVYYASGPVVFGFVWDWWRGRRWPFWTIAALIAFYTPTGWWTAWMRVVWASATLCAAAVALRTSGGGLDGDGAAAVSSL